MHVRTAGSAVLALLLACGPQAFAQAPPNAVLEVSRKLLTASIDQKVEQERRVEDTILLNRVSGRARTSGTIEAHLTPCEDHAIVDIKFRGVIDSRTVTDAGLASVSSTGKTDIDATKRIEIWDLQTVNVAPTKTQCTTETVIQDFSTKLQSELLRDAARDRADLLKPVTEQVAARHAEFQVSKEIDARFAQQAKLLQTFDRERFLETVSTYGVPSAEVSMSTSADYLRYCERRLDSARSQTWSPPPASCVGTCDLAIMAHETWFTAVAQGMLKGRWITDEQIADALKTVFGKVPPEYRLGTHMPRWSMHLDSERPIAVSFASGAVSLTFNVAEVMVGDKLVQLPFAIKVTYTIVSTEFGPELTRVGDVVVQPTGRPQEFENNAELRRFLTAKTAGAFDDVLYFDGLTLPNGGQFEKLRKLRQTMSTADGGWLAFGWKLD
jgi:hypothetical protein